MPLHRVTARRALAALALAFAGLAFPASAAADDETELVTWGTGGKEAGFGLGVEGHLGLSYRLNDSPLGEPDERGGFIYGLTGLVRPVRWLALGLGYEHIDLGQDQKDEPPSRFLQVERDLNTFWALARLYPVRTDSFALYLGLGAGAVWQSLDVSTASLTSPTTPNLNTTTCSGNDAAAFGFRGGLGAELPLKFGLVLMGEVGVDRYELSSDPLDACAVGAGGATLFAARLGFAYGLETTKKKKPEPPAPPPPPPDRDGDKIFDAYDACPDTSGVASNDPRKNGCPPPKDTDGDGFVDEVDACPTEPGVASEDPKKNGCPTPKDADNDGVIDEQDACKDIPGIKTADPATNGCPGDTDGDGFRDDKDACPTEKGIANEDPKRNGCPLVQVTQAEIVINEQVQFDTDRASIKPASFALLDTVAAIIKAHPDIKKIEVQGHTDTEGPRQHNMTLSQRRAESVRKALINRGVKWDSLDAKGYGPDVPIADNATPEGRTQNRRVQFKIVQRDAAAAGSAPAGGAPAPGKPGEGKPGEAKPGEVKPGDAKPAPLKLNPAKPEPTAPVEKKSEPTKPDAEKPAPKTK